MRMAILWFMFGLLAYAPTFSDQRLDEAFRIYVSLEEIELTDNGMTLYTSCFKIWEFFPIEWPRV